MKEKKSKTKSEKIAGAFGVIGVILFGFSIIGTIIYINVTPMSAIEDFQNMDREIIFLSSKVQKLSDKIFPYPADHYIRKGLERFSTIQESMTVVENSFKEIRENPEFLKLCKKKKIIDSAGFYGFISGSVFIVFWILILCVSKKRKQKQKDVNAKYPGAL